MCACRGTAGFAHVSCLAEQAKILVAEAEENNLDDKPFNERWVRWLNCSLCEQRYHGVVWCALGWACWKTYLGRPEWDWARRGAMSVLGNALFDVERYEDALSVQEAELSMARRLDASEEHILVVRSNLASTYEVLGRDEEALVLRRDVHSRRVNRDGEEHTTTLIAANNYALSLMHLQRYQEAKSLLRRTLPVARRVLGDDDETTLRLRWYFAGGVVEDPASTLDDLREAVATLVEIERTARRVLGGAHPTTTGIEHRLRLARAALRARETLSGKS
ncbi:unnamed protein product [Pelagomonas calceolata]|uniref:Tetratricopeptide repeat protein n=2 Tax=Pelagomonas calceolata TaxID=35677 RepID=A0A8J2T0M3_9STRA|nr:unnamed protein product [Pelagomonas calceolata]